MDLTCRQIVGEVDGVVKVGALIGWVNGVRRWGVD